MSSQKTIMRLSPCILLSLLLLSTTLVMSQNTEKTKTKVLLDTDANNELDDQHAMAYLFFNGDLFDIVGVTVNATRSGGNIDEQYREAKRVMQLSNVYGKMPLLKGANATFEEILPHIGSPDFDGADAVNFIIAQAHKAGNEKLVLLPVGKLTNIALALEKDPTIAKK